jgi:hypothetical protein
MSRWVYLKEKFADTIVVIVASGVVFMIGASVLLSFLGEYKIDKAILEMRMEMVERHNQSVMREAQMIQDLAELKRELEKTRVTLTTAMAKKETPLFVSPTQAPQLPSMFEVKGMNTAADPRQQASDWEKKHRETFILKK